MNERFQMVHTILEGRGTPIEVAVSNVPGIRGCDSRRKRGLEQDVAVDRERQAWVLCFPLTTHPLYVRETASVSLRDHTQCIAPLCHGTERREKPSDAASLDCPDPVQVLARLAQIIAREEIFARASIATRTTWVSNDATHSMSGISRLQPFATDSSASKSEDIRRASQYPRELAKHAIRTANPPSCHQGTCRVLNRTGISRQKEPNVPVQLAH